MKTINLNNIKEAQKKGVNVEIDKNGFITVILNQSKGKLIKDVELIKS